MTYNTITLPSGLRIIHRPSPSPVVYMGYEINAGTRDEQPGEEGLAHFCEHTTFKGTARRTALNILNCLESVGGELNAFTNKEDTVYYAAVLREHVGKAIALLSDIVFHSVYPQAELDKEVEVICDEIESYNDSPAELIYDDFENLVFSGHPLGHNILGEAKQLRAYGTDDALRFTRRLYHPASMVFFVDGDVDFKKVVRMVERETECLATHALPLLDTPATRSILPPYEPRKLTMEKGTHQSHVMLGTRAYDIFDRRRMALYLLNNILGGPGMNARLNLALRERNGLVYTVESSFVSYSDTGVWSVYFGCDPHDVSHCLRLVRHELDKLMANPLPPSRLAAAKRQLRGQIAIATDNRESFALDFGKSFLHYGWLKDVGSLVADVEALTAEDLLQAARETFAQENLTTLIYK